MTTVGNIGIGLLVLIILWIVALIIFVVAVRNQSNIGWFAVAVAIVTTIILIIIPTEKQQEQLEQIVVTVSEEQVTVFFFRLLDFVFDLQEKDYGFVYRTLLLTFIFLSVLIGFIAFFIVHCTEPIRAKTVKTF